MLSWFPTPYPEEWWYSVLCRYYVRTGIKQPSFVKKMLFEGQVGANMGVLFPNHTIVQVVKQLPSELFNIRQVILDHTPFKYYARMYPKKEQQRMLEWLSTGEVFQLSHLWKNYRRTEWAPRYCPVCVEEDTKTYGEPYYHVDHQISTMRVCPQHRCKLQQISVLPPYPALNQRFYPLSAMEKAMEPDYEYEPWEDEISCNVRAYWKPPLSVGPTEGYNNLFQAIKNSGYCLIGRQRTGTYLQRDKLYADLLNYFGRERVEQAFGAGLDGGVALRMERWEHLLPDRYILLQTMIGLPAEIVFSETPIQDDMKERMLKAAAEKKFRTYTQAAQELGLKRYELNVLLRTYGMEPFWMVPLKGKSKEVRSSFIRFVLDEDERQEIDAFSKEMGYRCVGHFAMHCIRYVMQQEKTHLLEGAEKREEMQSE